MPSDYFSSATNGGGPCGIALRRNELRRGMAHSTKRVRHVSQCTLVADRYVMPMSQWPTSTATTVTWLRHKVDAGRRGHRPCTTSPVTGPIVSSRRQRPTRNASCPLFAFVVSEVHNPLVDAGLCEFTHHLRFGPDPPFRFPFAVNGTNQSPTLSLANFPAAQVKSTRTSPG